MGSDSYTSLLSDSRWLKVKEEVLQRDSHKCFYCCSRVELEVHHVFYIPGKEPWDYPINLLVTLCKSCHKRWHALYGIEYCAEDGTPLTLYLLPKYRQVTGSKLMAIQCELRNPDGKVIYSEECLTWSSFDDIEVDKNYTPTNFHLSHKDNGVWLIPAKNRDSYHFKNLILKELNIIK